MTPPSTPPSAEQIAEALAGLRVSGHTAFETIRHQKRADILEAALSDAVKRTTEAEERLAEFGTRDGEYRVMTKGAFEAANRLLAKNIADNIMLTSQLASSETARRELEKAAEPLAERATASGDRWGDNVPAAVPLGELRALRRALSSPSTSEKNT